MPQLAYTPGAMQRGGLAARWHVRADGRRVVMVRDQRGAGLAERVRWWPVDTFTFGLMQRFGVRQGFAAAMIGRDALQS